MTAPPRDTEDFIMEGSDHEEVDISPEPSSPKTETTVGGDETVRIDGLIRALIVRETNFCDLWTIVVHERSVKKKLCFFFVFCLTSLGDEWFAW